MKAIMLAVAVAMLAGVGARAANFPYIRLNNQTNRISDNGTALTRDGVAIGGGSGTVGTMINTGTPAAGALPAATDTTGTNWGPSLLILTNQTVLAFNTNTSAASLVLPIIDPTRQAVLSTYHGDDGGGTDTTNSILLLGLNFNALSGGAKNTNASASGMFFESDYLGRSEWHLDMTHPQDATNTAHGNIRPIHIEKFTNSVDPIVLLRGSLVFGNQAGSNWMTLNTGGQFTVDPNAFFTAFHASGLYLGDTGLRLTTNAPIQYTNSANAGVFTVFNKTLNLDQIDLMPGGQQINVKGPITTSEPLTYNTAGAILHLSTKATTTAAGSYASETISLEFAPTGAASGAPTGLSVLVNNSNGNRPATMIGMESDLKMAGSGGFVTTGAAFRSAPVAFGGTFTTLNHYEVNDMAGSGGAITTQRGLYIPALSVATTNWGVYSASSNYLSKVYSDQYGSGTAIGITTTWTNMIPGVITQRISTVNGIVCTNLTL